MKIRLTSMWLALTLAGSGCVNTNRDTEVRLEPDPSGLVAHWTFDEGSGNTARDLTGHGHDATLKATQWVNSPRGKALRFTSKDSLAQYGNLESMMLSGDATLAVWVKTNASVAPNTHRLIFGDVGDAVMRNANLALDSHQRLSFEWGNDKETAAVYAPGSLIDGGWKHVVAVADSQNLRVSLYVDGLRVAEMPMALPISKTSTKKRITGWLYNGFFLGDLDDIRLYSRALSATEVQALFHYQADVSVSTATVSCDGAGPTNKGLATVIVNNLSREPRRVVVSEGPALASREISLKPGEQREVAVGEVPIQPVWSNRTDLYRSNPTSWQGNVAIYSMKADRPEDCVVHPMLPSVVEPLQVLLQDPWQAKMVPGKTTQLNLDLNLDIPVSQLEAGMVRVRLVSQETKREALSQELKSPQAKQSISLEVKALPWGAYDLTVSFHNGTGREVVSRKQVATILPGGSQQIRVLNNLASELMDAGSRGLLGKQRIEFMNPRQGWVWFRAAGACEVKLGQITVLKAQEGQAAVEAMRMLPIGKQLLEISGKPSELIVRAIPALVYNLYPSTTHIAPFGANTWERLSRYMLPNINMIESPTFDTAESRQWQAQGKCWLKNVQAPGLLDEKKWTVENLGELWLIPGKSTAWPEVPGLDISKVSGVQVDEYGFGTKSLRVMGPLVKSIAELSENPAFAGKLWIPFLIGGWGTSPEGILFFKTVWGAGWPFSEEVYLGEMSGETENMNQIRSKFHALASLYERAQPGTVRRMIFTLMYCSLPTCSTNRSPQSDFRVHLDTQMQMLATDPAFFGLAGVQPYRSNYADPETIDCMGMLLRHYAIEGQSERMLCDPYELSHIANADFEKGLKAWQVTSAESGSVCSSNSIGYGNLQGRYPISKMGDTFMVMTRNAKAPNLVSQQIIGLTPGRLYALKLITADYDDLQAGKSRKEQQVLAIRVDGAKLLEGAFSHSFPSPANKPFTAQKPFWMTYHFLRFRATGPTAQLNLSDWATPEAPGAAAGQKLMLNFVELQPMLESESK